MRFDHTSIQTSATARAKLIFHMPVMMRPVVRVML